MTLLRVPAASVNPMLTRVPMSTDPLPDLDAVPWPWPGRDLRLAGAGITLHVRDTPGPGPDAPRAVFVHGLAGSATNWTDLAGLLAVRATGLAVDLPGFGLSRPPATADYRLQAQADTVAALVAELGGGPVHLFGNSMGGAIALLVAAERPDLVATLTLISPAMPDLRPDLRRVSDPRMALAVVPGIGRSARRSLAALTPREHTERIIQLVFAQPDRISQRRLDQAVTEYQERAALPWVGSAVGPATGAILRGWLARSGRSLWSVAHRVRVPTLVVWGDSDRVISVRKGPRTARLLPRGRLLVLPRTGHTAQMERPVSVARAVLGMWDAVAAGTW